MIRTCHACTNSVLIWYIYQQIEIIECNAQEQLFNINNYVEQCCLSFIKNKKNHAYLIIR